MFKTKSTTTTTTTRKPAVKYNEYNDYAKKLSKRASGSLPKDAVLLAEAAKLIAETRIIMVSARLNEKEL